MGNSTLSFSVTLSSVPDSNYKLHTMPKEQELSPEEQVCLAQTKQALNTLNFSPRAATLKAIFEHAKNSHKK